MGKRLKVLLTILVVLILVGAGGLIYFQKQLKSSADSMSSGFASLAHHPETPTSPYNSLEHHLVVTPVEPIVINISPVKSTIEVGKKIQFNAVVTGSKNMTVIWTIADSVAKLGYIDRTTGLYTANGVGTVTILAKISGYTGPETGYATVTNVLPKYTIKSSAGTGGTISPNGSIIIEKGKSQVYTIKANLPNNSNKNTYKIADVKVDGRSVGAVSTYTFKNVTTNHSIIASFVNIPVSAMGNITGTVIQAGRPVVGTTVMVRNLKTNTATGIVTNKSGVYTSYSGLAVGNYSITATAKVCHRYWFINYCSNRSGTKSITVVPGRIVMVPTITF